MAVVVDDTDLDARDRRAARAGARRHADRRDRHHAGVGRAVAFGHVGHAEACHHPFADGRAAEAEDDAEAAQAEFGGQFRTIEVATSYTNTAYVQFARYANRYRMHCLI